MINLDGITSGRVKCDGALQSLPKPYFTKIVTPIFTKDIAELQKYNYDIRAILLEDSFKAPFIDMVKANSSDMTQKINQPRRIDTEL